MEANVAVLLYFALMIQTCLFAVQTEPATSLKMSQIKQP
jgi:hypothetical protein